jgi:hypothetical protein
MEKFKMWIEESLWSWKCCIYSRFVDYNDNIDRCAFFEELNYGWVFKCGMNTLCHNQTLTHIIYQVETFTILM